MKIEDARIGLDVVVEFRGRIAQVSNSNGGRVDIQREQYPNINAVLIPVEYVDKAGEPNEKF